MFAMSIRNKPLILQPWQHFTVVNLFGFYHAGTNERKVPILTAMEILRKDILSYSNQLMMNPKSLGEVVEQEGDSVLTEVLKFKNELKKKRVKDG